MIATREKMITDAHTKSLAMRANAEGVRFDTFTTQSGKMYSEVEFKTATDQGVRISHKDGTSTVPPGDLPPMLRQTYGSLLGDAIQAVQARKLPDLSAVSLTAGGATSKDPILAPEIKLGSDGRPISDSTKLMSAKAAEATFKRKQAEALRLKAKPGDKLFQQAVQLEEEAAQIERLLGVPPPRQQPRQ